MKHLFRIIVIALMLAAGSPASRAQYYEITNQLTNLISPALSGSFNYRGYVEASGLAGVGHNRANFIGISTTQGFRYANWFFMGAGIGVDVVMAQQNDEIRTRPDNPSHQPSFYGHSSSKTKAMIPVFSDFRFNIGDPAKTSFFIDIKLGAAWMLGSSYLCMNDACMDNSTQFYMRPSLGVRIPVNSHNSSQAFNIGLTYQLLTSGYNYDRYGNSLTLSNFGITLAYEW